MVALAWRINSGNMAALSWWGGGGYWLFTFHSCLFVVWMETFAALLQWKVNRFILLKKKIKNSTMHKIRTIWSTPYDDHMEYSIWWPYGVLHMMTIWSTPYNDHMEYSMSHTKNTIWSDPLHLYFLEELHKFVYLCHMEYSICYLWSTPRDPIWVPNGVLHNVNVEYSI